jgi:hypothetical protein
LYRITLQNEICYHHRLCFIRQDLCLSILLYFTAQSGEPVSGFIRSSTIIFETCSLANPESPATFITNEVTMPHRYDAFGLHITSEIECPRLVDCEDEVLSPDVVIRCGPVPPALEGVQQSGSVYQISPGRFLLEIEGVARYLVSSGCEIVVDRYPGADNRDVCLFLLGSAMGALLHQRGVWPLHGSAVADEFGAVIFLGASGSGKSTLAGALQQRGYRVLSDDICPISIDLAGSVQVWGAYPRISLWPDSIARLGSDARQLQQTHTQQEKYDFPLNTFHRGAAPVTAVYALYTADQAGIHLTPLHGFDKVRELTANTYRLHFLTGMQLEPQHFQQAQTLARQARLVRVTRPRQLFLLDELADLIERDFHS